MCLFYNWSALLPLDASLGSGSLLLTRVRSSNGVTRNYGNYRYGNYVGDAPRRYGNYSKDIKTKNVLLAALSIELKCPVLTGCVHIAGGITFYGVITRNVMTLIFIRLPVILNPTLDVHVQSHHWLSFALI